MFYNSYIVIIVLGAEIKLGDVLGGNEERILSIEGYFGLNPGIPADSWAYVKGNKLTLGKLARVFSFDQYMPTMFDEQGFPKGFIFSYSREGNQN